MTVLDDHRQKMRRTFGLSYWRSLAELERWAESHWTHLALYGASMKLYASLGAEVQFKRWHELAVVTADEQFFEYVNCHAGTGLLNADWTGFGDRG